MANRYLDSIGHYATVDIGKKYNDIVGNWFVEPGTNPRGGPCLAIDGTGTGEFPTFFVGRTFEDQDTWIVGMRVKLSTFAFGSAILKLYDGIAGAYQGGLSVLSDGRLAAWRGFPGSGTLLGSAVTPAMFVGVFAYVEMKYVIHPSAGSVQVRLDNALVINLSGINTQNTANGTASQIRIGPGNGVPARNRFCDIYIHDGTGGVDDNFWGDTQIDYLKPIADGPVNNYTPVGSSNHFENVDELTPNTADYNSDATPGDLEYYQIEAIAGTPIIKSIQSVGLLEKTDGNDRKIQYAVRESATNHLGSIQDVPSSPGYLLEQWGDDPGTSADWTAANANAARWGLKTNT